MMCLQSQLCTSVWSISFLCTSRSPVESNTPDL
uniref:Uncharacterized protein n=1 Tax=Arundo donax TaxID=35708 RepID=A0A0A9E858_ARUDO